VGEEKKNKNSPHRGSLKRKGGKTRKWGNKSNEGPKSPNERKTYFQTKALKESLSNQNGEPENRYWLGPKLKAHNA